MFGIKTKKDKRIEELENQLHSACNRILEQKPETGYWIDGWLNEYKSCPIVICSKCGMGGVTAYKEFSYCPNCGQPKMKEVEE